MFNSIFSISLADAFQQWTFHFNNGCQRNCNNNPENNVLKYSSPAEICFVGQLNGSSPNEESRGLTILKFHDLDKAFDINSTPFYANKEGETKEFKPVYYILYFRHEDNLKHEGRLKYEAIALSTHGSGEQKCFILGDVIKYDYTDEGSTRRICFERNDNNNTHVCNALPKLKLNSSMDIASIEGKTISPYPRNGFLLHQVEVVAREII